MKKSNKKNNGKILAIIPARSGSKGIKDKNVRDFCGKPLISYTIKEAKKSKYINRIIVSTDSKKYAEISKSFGAEVPFLRPAEFAGDKAPIVDAIVDLLNTLEKTEKYVPDFILLLQPTSPLRMVSDIDRCLEIIQKGDVDVVITMTGTEQLLYAIENGILKLLYNEDWIKFTNRQSLPTTYKINGPAILVAKVSSFLKNKSFLKGKIAGVVMAGWQSVDLDNENDFILAEIVYKNRRRFKK